MYYKIIAYNCLTFRQSVEW